MPPIGEDSPEPSENISASEVIDSANEENSRGVKRKFFLYSPEDLKKALAAVREGATTSSASRMFNVPRSTIRNKINGTSPETSGRTGRESVLGPEIEQILEEWLLESSEKGFPINKDCLVYSVKQLMDADEVETPFTNNLPGRKWFEGFLKRHPRVAQKRDEQFFKPKEIVTEKHIRLWFSRVRNEFRDKSEIWNDRRRVFSMDDTAVYTSLKGFVLAKRDKTVLPKNSCTSNDEQVSALFIVNAAGEYAPPLTLHKYEELSKIPLQAALKNWEIGKPDTTWMIYEAFYEYFSNTFYPYLIKNNIQLPVVVFVDGQIAHMSLYLSRFCRDHEIELCCIPSNASHILQPLDVAIFSPLKRKWKSYVENFRASDLRDIQKYHVPSLLLSFVEQQNIKIIIKTGFKCSGLYPFNVNAIDYTKCIEDAKQQKSGKNTRKNSDHSSPTTSTNTTNSKQLTHRQYIEKFIDPVVLTRFKQLKGLNKRWDISESYSALYELWSKALDDEVKQEIEMATTIVSETSELEALNFKGSVIFELPFFDSHS
ncbi:uncharacterized protein [Chelonus insularis]|uniref:uncharacterized protein n=1 Tax=Chelonus insularis TaxID=460826 RepID=UPI00158BB056|nr:uncharacterized protein LOC118066607 [Chelonus insularis]XP_034938622.1 uncharacterized protein LOC118066607 [Chelonus insularis]